MIGRARNRSLVTVVVATLATAVLTGGAWDVRAQADAPSAVAITTVNVTAGKPSEFRFKPAKRTVERGVVVFRVVNRGTLQHDFKIKGKKTPGLKPGERATLRVTFKKPGRYRFICTVPGHAAAGMKGVLRVT